MNEEVEKTFTKEEVLDLLYKFKAGLTKAVLNADKQDRSWWNVEKEYTEEFIKENI